MDTACWTSSIWIETFVCAGEEQLESCPAGSLCGAEACNPADQLCWVGLQFPQTLRDILYMVFIWRFYDLLKESLMAIATPQGFQYIATWQRLFCQATLEGWASVRGDGLQMGLEESQQLPLHGLEESISSLCSLAPKNVGHSAIHDLVDARDSYPFTLHGFWGEGTFSARRPKRPSHAVQVGDTWSDLGWSVLNILESLCHYCHYAPAILSWRWEIGSFNSLTTFSATCAVWDQVLAAPEPSRDAAPWKQKLQLG